MYGLDSSKWKEEKQLNDIYLAKARQRSYGDKYNQPKKPFDPEKVKQKQDMKRGDYIDEGTLDPKGNPLKIIQDAGKTLIDVLKILPALGGVNQLASGVEDPDMNILLPYVVDPEDEYSRPSEDPEMRRRGWNISHKKHYIPDGWSAPSQGHHDPAEHKQYDPGGGELYNPLDGGPVEKWGPQHEELISHNYRPGPTGGSIYNELMIRANQLMNSPNQVDRQRGLEILKISPEVYQLEKV